LSRKLWFVQLQYPVPNGGHMFNYAILMNKMSFVDPGKWWLLLLFLTPLRNSSTIYFGVIV